MRKEQDFIVYPIDNPEIIKIQSDTRIGKICLLDGNVIMSPPISSGAYDYHLFKAAHIDFLSADDLESLKTFIRSTATIKAGDNGLVFCDNSKAAMV
jgi:hypothetical protein